MILTLLTTSTRSVTPHRQHTTVMLILLIFDLLTSSNADTFSLVVPDGSISGQLGSSVVLPCALSPSLDCKDFEINWYRQNDEDNPVLVYRDLKVQENAGHPHYSGRVALVGDLQKGNVSLKVENLTLADRGEYVCFVDSSKWYEKASVFFTIPVVGSPPLLTLAEAGDQVNITCESGGWSPNTTLIWRDKGGRELRNSVDHFTVDSEGLVNVSSWLMFSPSGSERISCSVGLSDQEMREGRVLLLKPASATRQPGWTAFIILLVISLLVISLLIIPKIRGHILTTSRGNTTSTGYLEEEACHLVGEVNPPAWPVSTVAAINRADGVSQSSAGPEAANEETRTDKEKQEPVTKGASSAKRKRGESSPSSRSASTLTEKSRADGATQALGEVNPPSRPFSSERETNRADGVSQTSTEPVTKGASSAKRKQEPVTKDASSAKRKQEPVTKDASSAKRKQGESPLEHPDRQHSTDCTAEDKVQAKYTRRVQSKYTRSREPEYTCSREPKYTLSVKPEYTFSVEPEYTCSREPKYTRRVELEDIDSMETEDTCRVELEDIDSMETEES